MVRKDRYIWRPVVSCMFHCILQGIVQYHADVKSIDALADGVVKIRLEAYSPFPCFCFPFPQDNIRDRIPAVSLACRFNKG